MKNARNIAMGARGVAMFCLGAGAFINEVFLSTVERPYILAASGALMGLPFVFKGFSIVRNGYNKNNNGSR